MGETTGISWTDHTFNPWWGCWKIADECKNCYADSTAHRYVSQFGELWGRTADRRFFGDAHWRELAKWNRKAETDGVRRRVFIGSMCDWAEMHPVPEIAAQQDAARALMWAAIRECRSLDFLMLTKRPADALALLPWVQEPAQPWANVWIGTTAGTVKAWLENVPILRKTPARVRFISCEPMLEDIPSTVLDAGLRDRGVDWLIVGDESGHHARPAQVDWVRSAREAALRNGVAFHFKQWAGADAAGIGGRLPAIKNQRRKIHLPILDGKQWAQFPNKEQGK